MAKTILPHALALPAIVKSHLRAILEPGQKSILDPPRLNCIRKLSFVIWVLSDTFFALHTYIKIQRHMHCRTPNIHLVSVSKY